jgi:hypothetical protein
LLLGCLGLLALHAVLMRGSLRLPADSADEQVLLVYPLRLLSGDQLYRDIFTAYGPNGFWFIARAFAVTGPSVLVERLIGIGFHLLLIASVAVLAGRRHPLAALFAAAIPVVLLVPLGAVAYVWLAAAGLLVLTAGLARRETFWSLFVAGVAAGAAIGFRPDMVIAAVAVVAVVSLSQPRRRSAVVLGFVVGLTPVFVQLAITPGSMLSNVFLDRIGRAATASRLPLPPQFGDDRLLFGLVVASVAATVVIAARHRFRDATMTNSSVIALAATVQALQRADWVHLLMAASVTLPLAVIAAARSQAVRPLAIPPWTLPTAAALILVVVCFGAPHRVTRPVFDSAAGDAGDVVTVRHDGREMPLTRARAADLHSVFRAVEGLPRSSVLFAGPDGWRHPSATDLSPYFLLPEYRQDARQMEITPVATTAPGSGLLADLSRADVLVLVDSGDLWRRNFPYASAEPATADTYVARHFCERADAGIYRVLVRCSSDR